MEELNRLNGEEYFKKVLADNPNDFSEYLYLPFEETELTKALHRLGAEDL